MDAPPPTDGEAHQSEALLPPSLPSPVERTETDVDTPAMHSSGTPSSASSDSSLLPESQSKTGPRHPTVTVTPSFVSSPLNPNPPTASSIPPTFVGSRTQSRQSIIFNRIASEESQALTSQRNSLTPNRTSMILYRLADENEQRIPSPAFMNRQSVLSNSAESTFSVSYDSKYPFGAHTPHKLVPYPFDPSSHISTPEDDDALHDPSDNSPLTMSSGFPLRGFVNIGVLVLVIVSLLCLFIFYPVWHYAIQGNSTVP